MGSPAQTPSAVQWDALKKLVLVQCISKGKVRLLFFPFHLVTRAHRTRRHAQTTTLPKYVHPALGRLFKNSPYGAFAKAYPRQTAVLREIAEKEKDIFATVRAARVHSLVVRVRS